MQAQNVNEEIKGRYPVHYAADFGQLNVLEYLISIGADVDVSYLLKIETMNSKQCTIRCLHMYKCMYIWNFGAYIYICLVILESSLQNHLPAFSFNR